MAAARRSREPFFTKSQSFKLAGNKHGSDSPMVLACLAPYPINSMEGE
jgi:hypothetical protein